MRSHEDLHFDGTLKGQLYIDDATLRLGKAATVDADIPAKKVIVQETLDHVMRPAQELAHVFSRHPVASRERRRGDRPLRPDVGLAEARAEMDTIARSLEAVYPRRTRALA